MEEDRDDGKKKSNVCRLCLGSINVTLHIGHHSDKSTSIIDKIHYCTSLVVSCRLFIYSVYMYIYIYKISMYIYIYIYIHINLITLIFINSLNTLIQL